MRFSRVWYLFRTGVLKIKNLFKSVRYDPWWEDDLVQQFENEDEEVCIIMRQEIVLADTLPHEDVDFPWHGYSKEDFEQLHKRMTMVIKDAMDCKQKKDVVRFKKKNKEVYNAYFRNPIQIFEDSDRVGDGRHRIHTAQRLNSIIPVWKVEYVFKGCLTLDDYRKKMAFGEWRFLDKGF